MMHSWLYIDTGCPPSLYNDSYDSTKPKATKGGDHCPPHLHALIVICVDLQLSLQLSHHMVGQGFEHLPFQRANILHARLKQPTLQIFHRGFIHGFGKLQITMKQFIKITLKHGPHLIERRGPTSYHHSDTSLALTTGHTQISINISRRLKSTNLGSI